MTNTLGAFFEDAVLEQRKRTAWAAARIVPDFHPEVWRYDDHGNPIRYQDYGDRNSDYGWELDHIIPKALGGSDAVTNFRVRHWRANAQAGGFIAALRNLGA